MLLADNLRLTIKKYQDRSVYIYTFKRLDDVREVELGRWGLTAGSVYTFTYTFYVLGKLKVLFPQQPSGSWETPANPSPARPNVKITVFVYIITRLIHSQNMYILRKFHRDYCHRYYFQFFPVSSFYNYIIRVIFFFRKRVYTWNFSPA